jgi:hypothetical protein
MPRRALVFIFAASLTLGVAVPVAADEPNLIITIDRFGSWDAAGAAIVTGTVLCDPEVSSFFGGDVYVRQRVGGNHTDGSGVRGFTDGYGTSEGSPICDGTVHEWVGGALSRDVDDLGNFLYKAGAAFARICSFEGEACVEQDVILRPSR